jgi:hypothetical protein
MSEGIPSPVRFLVAAVESCLLLTFVLRPRITLPAGADWVDTPIRLEPEIAG